MVKINQKMELNDVLEQWQGHQTIFKSLSWIFLGRGIMLWFWLKHFPCCCLVEMNQEMMFGDVLKGWQEHLDQLLRFQFWLAAILDFFFPKEVSPWFGWKFEFWLFYLFYWQNWIQKWSLVLFWRSNQGTYTINQDFGFRAQKQQGNIKWRWWFFIREI